MTNYIAAARAACLALFCVFLVSCSQSSISTYGGELGKSKLSTAELRQKKILAARERARAIKAQRKAAFKAKREKRRAERLAKKSKKSASKRVTAKKKKSVSKRIAKKSAKKKKLARKTKTTKVGKVKRSAKRRLKSKKAFVPNVSRRAGKIRVNAPWKCVPSRLKRVIADVRKRYGSVTINSTHRSRSRNRMVGGKKRSYHLRCAAVDFRVHGKTRGLTRYLARHPLVGGYKRYRSGFYHIDTGPKRTW